MHPLAAVGSNVNGTATRKIIQQALGQKATRQLLAACVALALGGVIAPGALSAEAYKPLFAPAFLQSLDPAARARLSQLETENRERWENKNPRGTNRLRAQAEAQQQHEDTEHALRRFEESRRLKQREHATKKHRASLVLQHKRRCELLANEINQLRSGGALYEVAEDGSRQYLTEQEMKKRVKSGEKRYKEGCTG